ncbi:restriction endonuclease subunit S [Tetragenococcus halophilus]|uniref:restriction endonuclease subunit S n=1 Tax=Tetragenococcus halophilus TaxID=51669 RepID=UPI0030EFC9D5
MSKEEKRAPEVRFAGFYDDWEQRKLIEVADYRNGKAHEKDISENGDYIVVNSKFVSTNGAVKKFSDELIAPLKKGELAFVLSDVPNGRAIARTFLIDEDNKYSLNQRIAGITPHSDTNSYFLHSLMNRHHYFLRFDDGAGQTNLSKKEVENWTELYPSIEEQDKIGSFFKQLDDTITLHQEKLSKIQSLKKAALQSLFPEKGETEPKVRFTNFNELWNQRKLGEMGDTFAGLSGKTKKDFGHGNAKFITYVNVFQNPISDPKGIENIEIDNKQATVRYGDIFFTTSSETPEEAGMSSVWLENTGNVYLNSFCFGYRLNIENDPYYLAFLLRSSVIRKKLILLAQGISRYNISKKKAMEITIPIPTLEEQKHVGVFLKKIDDTISFEQTKLEELQKLKKAFLQKMFI